MEQAMRSYFRGERLGGYGFAATGVASLIAGGLMLGSSSDFYHGMSYPMLGLGAAELAVGTIVIFTSGPRMARFSAAIGEQPGEYRAAELDRMHGVKRTFRLLFFTEAAIALGGLAMGIYGVRSERDTVAGIGFGLSIQALVLLGQDTLAARRARRYTRALDSFQVALSPGERSYMLSYGARW
jgi:hypothetical protein